MIQYIIQHMIQNTKQHTKQSTINHTKQSTIKHTKEQTIFNKDIFTLKELCYFIKNNKIKNEYVGNIWSDDLNIINKTTLDNILNCYLLFSSNNEEYRFYLNNTRNNKGFLLYTNNKIINLREILQILDLEFTKLVIRIKTEPKNYDISISWEEFEKNVHISKNDLMNLFYFEK
jgi:hypothetical protein